MTTEPEIRMIREQRAVVVRAVTDPADLPQAVDRAFPALFAMLGERGIAPAGAPFIRYLATDGRFEIELGVPVPPGENNFIGFDETTLPAGRTAVYRHLGSYDGLMDACAHLFGWIEGQGEHPSGPHWEAYVTDPSSEADPTKWTTDIYVPLG